MTTDTPTQESQRLLGDYGHADTGVTEAVR